MRVCHLGNPGEQRTYSFRTQESFNPEIISSVLVKRIFSHWWALLSSAFPHTLEENKNPVVLSTCHLGSRSQHDRCSYFILRDKRQKCPVNLFMICHLLLTFLFDNLHWTLHCGHASYTVQFTFEIARGSLDWPFWSTKQFGKGVVWQFEACKMSNCNFYNALQT